MQRHSMILALALVFGWSTLVAPVSPQAQPQDSFTDLRSRAYTAADLAAALFPEAVPLARTRGVGPRQPQAPPPGKTAVALNVVFDFDSDTILPKYYPDLDKLGEVLVQYAQGAVEISGHTDNVGPDPYNQLLSQKRAESVQRYLAQRFPIAVERLRAVGYGKSLPRATNDTPAGRSINRRVEVMRQP